MLDKRAAERHRRRRCEEKEPRRSSSGVVFSVPVRFFTNTLPFPKKCARPSRARASVRDRGDELRAPAKAGVRVACTSERVCARACAMSKRARDPVTVVNATHATINQYHAAPVTTASAPSVATAVPVATVAAEADETEDADSDSDDWDAVRPVAAADAPASRALVETERGIVTTVKWRKKMRPVDVAVVGADGALKGGCHNCTRCSHADLATEFAPADGDAKKAAKRTKFLEIDRACQEAYAAEDHEAFHVQLRLLVKMRAKTCTNCRGVHKRPSRSEQECKDWWDNKRKEMCSVEKNNGCHYPDCPVRGAEMWPVISANHGENAKATHTSKNRTTGELETHPLNLSQYKLWPMKQHGGVEGMKREELQIENWPCLVCHALEPTSDSGRRCTDPALMPPGRRNGTKDEIRQYKKRRKAVVKFPKQQYVDALKRLIGACAHCGRAVVPGTEQAFAFDHLDESTKGKGGIYGAHGGVSGLVNNDTNRAALAFDTTSDFEPIEPLYDAVRLAKGLGNPTGRIRALLDAETALCQLLCNNCHHCKTWGYPRLPKCVPCAPAAPATGLSAEDAAFKAAWDSDDDEW